MYMVPSYPERDRMDVRIETVGQEKPRISVIIPVDDFESNLTLSCVDTIRKNDKSNYRIILVQSKGNEFAYGRSVNFGMRFVEDSEFVAVMDSDTSVKKNAIRNAETFLSDNPNVGFSGAWIYTPHSDRLDHVGFVHLSNMILFIWNCVRKKAPFFALRRIARGSNWSYGVLGVTRYVPGRMVGVSSAFCIMRKKCYDEVGPWDEEYRSSFVDVDYSFRTMLSKDWFVSSSPDVRVSHLGQVTKRKYGHGDFEGLDAYLRKWPHDRIDQVLEAGMNGKFIIPTRLPGYGKT